MGVHAVTRIDHVAVECQRDALGKAGFVMAYDDDGDPQRARA